MSVSDWERKRTLDAMFQHVPPHLRTEFLERVKKEQDKMDKEKDKGSSSNGKKTAFIKAPDKPKNGKTATGQAKKAGASGKGDKKASPKPDASRVSEVMTGQLGMVTPRPMMVTALPGIEPRPDLGFSAPTTAGSDDGHTHTGYYDEAGNGSTSTDDDHSHDIRSFAVADYQTPHGQDSHSHYGALPRQERTPGAEYKDYTGELL